MYPFEYIKSYLQDAHIEIIEERAHEDGSKTLEAIFCEMPLIFTYHPKNAEEPYQIGKETYSQEIDVVTDWLVPIKEELENEYAHYQRTNIDGREGNQYILTYEGEKVGRIEVFDLHDGITYTAIHDDRREIYSFRHFSNAKSHIDAIVTADAWKKLHF